MNKVNRHQKVQKLFRFIKIILLIVIVAFSPPFKSISINENVSFAITIIFISLFTILLILLEKEFVLFKKNEGGYKEEISELNRVIFQAYDYMKHSSKEFVDPVKAGLTKTELVVLKNLCIYNESNNELGKRLCKSPNTVKVQFCQIMNKIGAENRYQLIDLCKNYFIDSKIILHS